LPDLRASGALRGKLHLPACRQRREEAAGNHRALRVVWNAAERILSRMRAASTCRDGPSMPRATRHRRDREKCAAIDARPQQPAIEAAAEQAQLEVEGVVEGDVGSATRGRVEAE